MTQSKNFNENIEKLAQRKNADLINLEQIEKNAIANFTGQINDLGAALGMLRLGDHMGWRVIALIHNKRTIRKYEGILDISIREQFPEVGPSSDRSIGYKLARKIGNYWKIVSGDIKIDNKKEIE